MSSEQAKNSDYDRSLALYDAGRAAMDAGNYPDAIQKFRESVQLTPHYKTLELLGECLLATESAGEAVIYLAAAVGLGTKQVRSRFLLAKCLISLGERESAMDKLEEALTINPGYKSARELLWTLKSSGDV